MTILRKSRAAAVRCNENLEALKAALRADPGFRAGPVKQTPLAQPGTQNHV